MYSLALKSLILSILLHLIVVNLFIFTFPVIPPAHKPMFIFLGSILKKQDISNFSLNKNPAQAQMESREFAYKSKNDKNPFFVFSLNKPYFESIPAHEDKKTIKPTFDTTSYKKVEVQQKENTHKSLEIQLEPYTPLKLNDR